MNTQTSNLKASDFGKFRIDTSNFPRVYTGQELPFSAEWAFAGNLAKQGFKVHFNGDGHRDVNVKIYRVENDSTGTTRYALEVLGVIGQSIKFFANVVDAKSAGLEYIDCNFEIIKL